MINSHAGSMPVAMRVLWVVLFLKIAMLFILSVNTMFVMDEFWQFGHSKHLYDELFRTIWPGKSAGYAVFYKVSHWIGWDAQSMLLAGRLQTAVLSTITTIIIYRIARAMGEPVIHAALIALVMLCFSTFMERSFRLRSEPLAVFFASAALWAVVSDEKVRWRSVIIAGVLSGLSFLTTQKAAYFNFALGMALVSTALLNRKLRDALFRGCFLVFGWTLPIIVYCIAFRPDNPLLVAENLVYGPLDVALSGHEFYADLRVFVTQTVFRNLPLYALCAVGLIMTFRQFFELNRPKQIAAIFTLIMSALIFSHSQPWPYVFVMVIPFLALWAAGPVRYLSKTPLTQKLLLLCGAVVVVLSFHRNFLYLSHDNSRQIALMQQVEEILSPTETYFDGSGMLPNRRQSVEHFLDARWVWLTKSEGESSEVYRELSASPPKVLIDSYRLTNVGDALAPLIKDRYVGIAPNIRVAGRKIESAQTQMFDVPYAGSYRLYDPDGARLPDALLIDGVLQEPPFQLDAGERTISIDGTTPKYLLPDDLPFPPLPSSYTIGPVYLDVYAF